MSDFEMYRGYKIKIEQDDMIESPRDWDNLGTMCCWHRDYNLGDYQDPNRKKGYFRQSDIQHGKEPNLFHEPDQFVEWIEKHQDEIAVIYPLFLLDHSGLGISAGRYECDYGGWDTSRIGYIFVTKEQLRKEYNKKRISEKLLEQARKCLLGEIDTYDQYLSGDVWWYEIADEHGEIVDSCGGFYGYQYCLDEAKSVIDYHEKEEAQRMVEKVLVEEIY